MSNIYITEPATTGKVCIQTTLGDIDIELWTRESPLACRNFIQLCIEGYYNGCIFHRLVKGFIVQTGDPSGTGEGGESVYGEPFKSEFHQRLKFNRRGLVGMAGEKKDQNGSQFFFTLSPAPDLNNKHTLFGKVVGDTLYNLLKIDEYEVDKNERPSYLHKITGAKILSNPFKDIKIRKEIAEEKERGQSKKEQREKEKSKTRLAVKNTSLLSFGDEIDEDEEQIAVLNRKLKPKSAHDALDDELLSKESAVKPEELGNYEAKDAEEVNDEKGREERLDRIKAKLKGSRKRENFTERDDEDDLEKTIDEQKEAEKREEMLKLSTELKLLQKEYKKAMRGPKEAKIQDVEATTSEGMKSYSNMKLKFKKGTKGIVKTIDPKREDQTMSLLGNFETRLQRASVQGILMDKKVDMSDQKTLSEIVLATSEDQGKPDFEAPDLPGDEWMDHMLVAPEDTSGVTKARDANMKEFDDGWYPIDDPRHPMNVRKRMAGEVMPESEK